jgi:N-hydroxyarylamine O-acetyltransferase
LDLDAWFERIGYRGPTAPTIDTLHALAGAHAQAIPFENVDVLLGRGIDLADAAVDDKLLRRRRGGYCFEQNTLMMRALTRLGYRVRPLSARVRQGRPRDVTPPRTHVFLEVQVDGAPWMVDVGVGGFSLTSALRMDTEAPQTTPHETRRLVRDGGLWKHQVLLGETWMDLAEYTGEEMPAIDREVGNWYTSAHPQSRFRTTLMVGLARPDGGRLTLLNRELTERTRDGVVHTTVADHDALVALLADRFGIAVPEGAQIACEGLAW